MCEPTAVACTLEAYCQNRWAKPQKTPLPYTHPNSGPRLQVLKALQEKPDITQRELAARLGVSLGQVNYCVKALVDKGHVKVGNFAASGNKLKVLTGHSHEVWGVAFSPSGTVIASGSKDKTVR